MDKDDERLAEYYQRFTRDHARLRDELLQSLRPIHAATVKAAPSGLLKRLTLAAGKFGLTSLGRIAAATTAGIIVVVIGWRMAASSPIYASVIDRVEKLKTVQYTKARLEPEAARQVTRVYVSGRYLERQEILGPGEEVLAIVISNLRTGERVLIDPQNKRCEILSRQRTIKVDGAVKEDKTRPAPTADLYETIRAVPPEAVPRFPVRQLDGKTVVGYYQQGKTGVYIWKRTYWIDAQKLLPVQIDSDAASGNSQWGAMKWQWSHFVFDEPLDPALFSTEPPAGYTVVDGEVTGFEMPKQ